MKVFLNGESLSLNASESLETLLQTKELYSKKGIAVAVNNKVIRKTEWDKHVLKEGDKVLVISATKGG